MQNILGRDIRLVQPPLSLAQPATPKLHRTQSDDAHDRRPIERALVAEGVHRTVDIEDMAKDVPDKEDSGIVCEPAEMDEGSSEPQSDIRRASSNRGFNAQPKAHQSGGHSDEGDRTSRKDTAKGHAHNPLEDYLFLSIGLGGEDDPPNPPAVSESPPAADISIYETAYHEQIERLRQQQGKQTTLYLTRRVEHKQEYQKDDSLVGAARAESGQKSGIAKILEQVRERDREEQAQEEGGQGQQGRDDGGQDDTSTGEGSS